MLVVFLLPFLSVTAQAEIPEGSPDAPGIVSPSFPSSDEWYGDVNGVFAWELPEDVIAVAAEIASESDHEPQVVLEPMDDEITILADDIAEGVNYFQLQFKNEAGWGEVASYEFRVDSTPPPYVEFLVEKSDVKGGWPLLLFTADDASSGIDRYEIRVAGKEPVSRSAKEARFGYILRDLEDGDHPVTVTAYDKAGNHSSVFGTVEVKAGWIDPTKPTPKTGHDIEFTFGHWLILFLAMIVAGQLVYIYRQYKERLANEARLLHEALEIRTQMEKIFTALRDEIYDQVSAMSKRSKLSKREKETVKTLTQALEVSETLIEKEVKDVQKLVKK